MDTGHIGNKAGSCDKKEAYRAPGWLPYADIIDRPHPVSSHHRPMTMEARAAQFSPFAALTGYEAAVEETARLTEEKKELDEDEKARLDKVLRILSRHVSEQPEVTVTYFEPDQRKSGGTGRTITGNVKKIDTDRQRLVLTNGHELPLNDLLDISCQWDEKTDELRR